MLLFLAFSTQHMPMPMPGAVSHVPPVPRVGLAPLVSNLFAFKPKEFLNL